MQENFYSDINLSGNKLLNAQISLETVDALPLNTETELIQLGRTVVYQNQLYRYTRLVTDVDLATDGYLSEKDDMAPIGSYVVYTGGALGYGVFIHRAPTEWELYAEWVPISAGQEKFDELESKIDGVQMGIKHLKPVDYFADFGTNVSAYTGKEYTDLASMNPKSTDQSEFDRKLSNGLTANEIMIAKGYKGWAEPTVKGAISKIETFHITSDDDGNAYVVPQDLVVGDRILEKTTGIWEVVKISDTDYRFARPLDFPVENVDASKFNSVYVFVQKGSKDISSDTGFLQSKENSLPGAFEFTPFGTSPSMVRNLVEDAKAYTTDLHSTSSYSDYIKEYNDITATKGTTFAVDQAGIDHHTQSYITSLDEDSVRDFLEPEDQSYYAYNLAKALLHGPPKMYHLISVIDEDGTDITRYYEMEYVNGAKEINDDQDKVALMKFILEKNRNQAIDRLVTIFGSELQSNFETSWDSLIESPDPSLVGSQFLDYYKIPVFKGNYPVPATEFYVDLTISQKYRTELFGYAANYILPLWADEDWRLKKLYEYSTFSIYKKPWYCNFQSMNLTNGPASRGISETHNRLNVWGYQPQE